MPVGYREPYLEAIMEAPHLELDKWAILRLFNLKKKGRLDIRPEISARESLGSREEVCTHRLSHA